MPVDFLGDTQQERVSPPDRTRRWMNIFAAQRSLLETPKFGGIDPVGEGGVNDDGDLGIRVVAPELGDGFFQLSQARQERPSVAMLDPSTTMCSMGMPL